MQDEHYQELDTDFMRAALIPIDTCEAVLWSAHQPHLRLLVIDLPSRVRNTRIRPLAVYMT